MVVRQTIGGECDKQPVTSTNFRDEIGG